MSLIGSPPSGPVDTTGTSMFTGWRNWFNSAGALLIGLTMSGTTANRPTEGLWVGRPYFDTTLVQMVFWTGTAWTTGIPAFPAHNALSGLQGGTANEYYHLTAAQYAAFGSSVTMLTPQTLSGTTIDFTFPTGVKKIWIPVVGASTNGATDYLCRLGDAGGIEVAAYTSGATDVVPNPTVTNPSTTGFVFATNVAATDAWRGVIELTLENASTFTWGMVANMWNAATAQKMCVSAGSKSLSQELTTVRLTSVTPNTWDAGEASAAYAT